MRIWINLAAAVVGLLPAFVAGATVFETGSTNDYLIAFGSLAAGYALLGAILGYLAQSWTTGIALSLAGVVMAFLFSESMGLSLAVAACIVLPACLGAAATARYRSARRPRWRR